MAISTWLFQSNPKIYDLSEDLKNFQVGDEDGWQVRRYKNEMKPGDRVILWVSGRQAGVYALGELTEEPRNEGDETRVSFQYTQVLENPIFRNTIIAHPILRGMEIIRMPQGTNFRVTDKEWGALQQLMQGRNAVPRIWKISAGELGKNWHEFHNQNLIGVSFEGHFQGDLTPFSSFEDLFAAIKQKEVPKPKYVTNQLWTIRHEMYEGDIVLAYGNGAIRGQGHIIGTYQYSTDASFPYPHRRDVVWNKVETIPISILSVPLQDKLTKQATIIELSPEEYQEILGIKSEPDSSARNVPLIDELTNYFTTKGYRFSSPLLATFVTALQTKGFVILSGLSGTGKTKLAQHLAELLPKPRETLETVEETARQGFINITVQPSMIKRSLFVIPKPFWQLIDVPPEGEVSYITLNFEGQKEQCRFAHHSYATGDYLLLSLKGKAREWFNNHFTVGDSLILYPQSNLDNEFTGFELGKPQSIPVQKRRYLPNYTFITVRPDWRDNKSLLGYYNPLIGVYDDTPFLRFLLQAKAHYDVAHSQALPHFVILDEMNLARVEYYFADFLSVLESGRDNEGYSQEAIQLHSQDPEQTFGSRGLAIPQNIKLPPNLYIIGTVNMDETTHAFSPKVLDRAFTIEFNEVDFQNYPPVATDSFDQSHKEQLQQALLAGFQRDGKFAQIDKNEITHALQHDLNYGQHLQILNKVLFNFDLHFGYRVFDEIAQFMAVAAQGNLFNDLDTAFDVAVLMKVLPKFNGPRSRLRQPLEIVIVWAKNPAAPESEDIAGDVKDSAVCRRLLTQLPAEFVYPETARKAIRMLIRLHETGFASFA